MNIETIEQIVALMSEHPVSEITVERDGNRLYIRRPASGPAAPADTPQAAEAPASGVLSEAESSVIEVEAAAESEPIVLTSPMVGLFHHLSPPIPYGGLIALHQMVGSIESMKLMNDVEAEHSGRVVEVLVEDGAPVEYGQPLFRLVAA